jgi:hypothetical protein
VGDLMKSFKEMLTESEKIVKGTANHLDNSIDDHVYNDTELPEHFKDIQNKKELSDNHINALRKYATSYGSKAINGIARSNHNPHEDIIDNDEVKAHTRNLDSLINYSRLNHDTHVWRGISPEAKRALKLGKNTIVHDKGFVSTSLNPRMAIHAATGWHSPDGRNNHHVMHIHLPKGTKGIHLPTHGSFSGRTEAEILLPRHSKFRYLGSDKAKSKDGHKITIHHLEHIPGEEW